MYNQSYFEKYDNIEDVEFECRSCNRMNSNKENMKEFLTSILEQLYSNEPLNIGKLEDDLDNLCHQLDMKIMPGEMQIQRLEQPSFLNSWVKFNNDHLRQARA